MTASDPLLSTSTIDHDLTPSASAQSFAQMQQHPQILGARRHNPDPSASRTTADHLSAQREATLQGPPAPAFSKSSLYQVGMVEGITSPALAEPSTSPIQVSSVVAAGLEMGLGVSLANAALMTHAPGAQAAALSSLTKQRYSRPHATGFEHPSPSDQDGLDSDLSAAFTMNFDDSQTTSAAITLPYRSRSKPSQDFAQEEGDLHRRRTTGTRDPKQRFEPMRLGRHHRADTLDHIVAPAAPPTIASEIERQQYYQNNYIALRNEAKVLTHGLPNSFNIDVPLSATTSVERDSSVGGRSSTHASASIGASTQVQTPSLDYRVMFSPDSHQLMSDNPFAATTATSSPNQDDGGMNAMNAAGWKPTRRGAAAGTHGPTQAALMGLGGGSHFGPGVRAKVSEVLPHLVSSIPLSGQEHETITIAEYGSLNTRSINLMQPIISAFVEKAHADTPGRQTAKDQEAQDYFPGLDGAASLQSILGMDASADEPCKVNFSIIHEDSPQADFRPLSQMLDTNPESYLHPQWQATHQPPLHNALFPSFVARPFASRIAPPSTLHLGISLMDLHWSHTPRNPTVSLSTSAHAELTAFLTARAHEFRKGGVILMAYIARPEETTKARPDRPRSTIDTVGPTDVDRAAESPASDSDIGSDSKAHYTSANLTRLNMLRKERRRSNSSPNRPSSTSIAGAAAFPPQRSFDIWTTLTDTLAPCLQRLVSCGMLKSDVARHLLSLPMHARTPRQTRNVLTSVKHLWNVEWSCGLGEEAVTPESTSCALVSDPEPLRLPHPAWKALQAGTLSRVAFAEHMIQLFKNLYESHFRAILREKGKLSKGAVEFVLDSLWDVLQSRIDDQEPCPIAECELEVQVVALRRI